MDHRLTPGGPHGGAPRIEVRVQETPLDFAREQALLCADTPQAGALVTFVGLMRDRNDGHAVSAMTLEHYPGMTEASLEAVAREAWRRWDLLGIRVVHRVGRLAPQDPIVFVGVLSAHRGDAFRACELLIDYLKTRAPFWKKELTDQGERWVAARDSDQSAADRWSAGAAANVADGAGRS
jgi:molybdopterin synthase catalytic subunit